jgi:hypothetical protein
LDTSKRVEVSTFLFDSRTYGQMWTLLGKKRPKKKEMVFTPNTLQYPPEGYLLKEYKKPIPYL